MPVQLPQFPILFEGPVVWCAADSWVEEGEGEGEREEEEEEEEEEAKHSVYEILQPPPSFLPPSCVT